MFPYIKLYRYSYCPLQVPPETFPRTKSRLRPCYDLRHLADRLPATCGALGSSPLQAGSLFLPPGRVPVDGPQHQAVVSGPFFSPGVPALVCLLSLSLPLAFQELKSWLLVSVSRPRFHQDRGLDLTTPLWVSLHLWFMRCLFLRQPCLKHMRVCVHTYMYIYTYM